MVNVNLTLRYEDNQMEIKHKLTNEVLLTIEGDSLQGANLQGTDLRWANLQDANLQDANLKWANLKGANLQDANLQDANLKWANLQDANLKGADLQWADLRGANLPTDVIRLNGMRWAVTIFQDWMTIGCQHHHIDDWDKFTDDEISKMDDDALEFWKENKGKLIAIANLTK